MLVLPDGALDDGGVESIRDERDDQIVLGDLGVEGLVVVYVEGDGVGILDTFREFLGALEGSAGFSGVSMELRQMQGNMNHRCAVCIAEAYQQ